MTENPKLPDPATFTKKQLAERWKCDISLIERYINTGQLKEGFDVFGAGYGYLRQLKYFLCEDEESFNELEAILDTKTWSEIASSKISKKFLSFPRFLYLPFIDTKEINAKKITKSNLFNSVRNIFLKNYSRIDFFCDLEDTPLIPIVVIDEKCIMISVRAPKLEDMIIPLEEILRFEKKHFIKEKREGATSAITYKEKSIEQEQKDSEIALSKRNDKISHRQPPFDDDFYLREKEVCDRIGFKRGTVNKWVKEGKFPQPEKIGISKRWWNSAISNWMDGKWKKEDDEKTVNKTSDQ